MHCDTSGCYHVVTDIFDIHDYIQDPEAFRKKYDRLVTDHHLEDVFEKRQTYRGEPCFVSEYGGIQWAENGEVGWGYGEGPKTKEEFLKRYQGLTDAFLDNAKIFGFCYTQLYDIEQEIKGHYTYDRKAKFDPSVIKKINRRKAKMED